MSGLNWPSTSVQDDCVQKGFSDTVVFNESLKGDRKARPSDLMTGCLIFEYPNTPPTTLFLGEAEAMSLSASSWVFWIETLVYGLSMSLKLDSTGSL